MKKNVLLKQDYLHKYTVSHSHETIIDKEFLFISKAYSRITVTLETDFDF